MRMQKLGLILMAVWLVSAVASWLDLVPREVELVGLGLGAVGVLMLFLARKRRQ